MASDLEVLILIPAALHTRLQTAPVHAEGPVTKGNPAGVQHALGTGLTYCLAMRTKLLLRSYRDRTALSKGPQTPYSRSTPHRIPRGTRSNAFSRSTKHMWTGWANSHKPSSTLWRV
ncbi:hypothetical protein L3Q82_021178 [Scortum barcoo]|uniref:Uncharacterized protein n=1 Tax=Scortum barcoo TaxID=214431 RepID=A0ACB8X3C5_9TELE|nr:hypothetical protein L3Q82_021178 [Scortum barcoo]